MTVTVQLSATSPQTNTVKVSTAAVQRGSGNSNNTANDSTIIVAGTAGSLSVTKTGSGAGTVTSADGGIACGATCSAAYVNTSVITLTAAPNAGAVFSGWLGACTGLGTCLVTINGAQAVSATFASSAIGARVLDINSGNQYLPESEGVLVLRDLFGLRGTSLTAGLSLTSTRTGAAAIEAYLRDITPLLDVDGNGVADALTDSLLILRQLLSPSGPLLIQNAVGRGATRVTATDLNNHILTLRS